MKRYPFGKFILEIPDDHKIIEIHRDSVFYDRSFGLVLEEIGRENPRGTIIDIGANIGDTAAFIATYTGNPILSVEGNEDFIGYYNSNKRRIGDQVSLVEKFVHTDTLSKLSLTYASGGGTGAMRVADTATVDSQKFISTDDLIKLAGKNIALVKSDTDGLDGFIISDFLAKTDAPLFFECDTIAVLKGAKNPWPALFSKLQEKRYSVVVFDNFGLPMFIEDSTPEQALKDLSGYVHLQRAVHPTRIHYLDVWAFPPGAAAFKRVASRLRNDMLKPYDF
ncbi:hypothetical protein A6U85_23965 [Agrobacterium sp. 13-626]|uniref:hypothetical protein n=1 Tax=Rhizobium rhizogenes TaxID=359 RepID=UPI00080FCAF1|nr:hypothetical protein [Rhizobium rhizogenes]OCI91427.1 hypothetical protein A6U85_23965 [Agrobacterium sp. 13-626]NTF50358.1 hypothetical protein [Rhizobium rhizogenes]NTH07738.1 hypothetical protein [Rhizobium rhizogenes]NTH46741.1 hypothetical protein [Rhizobium rhizogenes]NTH59622.1 hypothetical protein [Rhizobium rhizogenes]